VLRNDGGLRGSRNWLLLFGMSRDALEFVVMVLYVAQVMATFCDSSAKSILEPHRLSGQLWKLFSNMSDIELIIESIAIAAQSLAKAVAGRCLPDQARNSSESADAGPNLPKELALFIYNFRLTFIKNVVAVT
jgi:hypothetical protein